jgi:glycosyltransferase involved in cell wall biosynthesis
VVGSGQMTAQRLAVGEPVPTVLIMHAGHGDAYRYRCENLREQFELLGWSTSLHDLGERDARPPTPARLCIAHRVALDRFVAGVLQRIRSLGTVVLFDADDLILDRDEADAFSLSIGDSRLARALWRLDLKGMRATFDICDGALMATEILARHARAAGKTAWVHRNAFSHELLRISEEAGAARSPRDRIVIGYASGTPTHDRDFAVVKPVLAKLLCEHQNIELHVVGHLDPGGSWGNAAARVIRRPHVPWRSLPSLIAGFDVNIAPLEIGRPFCEGKSEVKYIEAGLLGVPTVATSTEAFRCAIRDGENGFLATNEDHWMAALTRLVSSDALRRTVGERAAADVRERYAPQRRAEELAATLRQALGKTPGRGTLPHRPGLERAMSIPPAPLQPWAPPVPWLLYRAWYSLRYEGVRTFALRGCASLARRLHGARNVLGQ